MKQINYQITVFSDSEPPRTSAATNREEVERRVDDALMGGWSVLITQQSEEVADLDPRTDEDRCTCPMSLRERGEHSMGCSLYTEREPVGVQHPW